MPRWLLVFLGVFALGALGVFAVSRISDRGINKIKAHEKFMPEPYQDEAGIWTIGWGHRILQGDTFTLADGRTVKAVLSGDKSPLPAGSRIDEQEGTRLLRRDLAFAEEAVARLVKVPLTQNQYDALVSFVFNVGAGAFEFGGPGGTQSTLLKKLNARDYSGAAAEFERWNKVTVNGEKVVSNGLSYRRQAERDLFVA